MIQQFTSDDLSRKLWNENEDIVKYVDFVRDHTTDSRINKIMGHFIGIPCDRFRRLVRFLAFQEVVVLIHQGKVDSAELLIKKDEEFGRLFWYNGPIDLIESGRLLSSGQ